MRDSAVPPYLQIAAEIPGQDPGRGHPARRDAAVGEPDPGRVRGSQDHRAEGAARAVDEGLARVVKGWGTFRTD